MSPSVSVYVGYSVYIGLVCVYVRGKENGRVIEPLIDASPEGECEEEKEEGLLLINKDGRKIVRQTHHVHRTAGQITLSFDSFFPTLRIFRNLPLSGRPSTIPALSIVSI